MQSFKITENVFMGHAILYSFVQGAGIEDIECFGNLKKLSENFIWEKGVLVVEWNSVSIYHKYRRRIVVSNPFGNFVVIVVYAIEVHFGALLPSNLLIYMLEFFTAVAMFWIVEDNLASVVVDLGTWICTEAVCASHDKWILLCGDSERVVFFYLFFFGIFVFRVVKWLNFTISLLREPLFKILNSEIFRFFCVRELPLVTFRN